MIKYLSNFRVFLDRSTLQLRENRKYISLRISINDL